MQSPKVQAVVSQVLKDRLEKEAFQAGITVSQHVGRLLELYHRHQFVMLALPPGGVLPIKRLDPNVPAEREEKPGATDGKSRRKNSRPSGRST